MEVEATAGLLDGDGRANTGATADELGKTAQQCSSYRSRLISRRLLHEDGWGYVRFGLPHMTDYFRDDMAKAQAPDPRGWKIS